MAKRNPTLDWPRKMKKITVRIGAANFVRCLGFKKLYKL